MNLSDSSSKDESVKLFPLLPEKNVHVKMEIHICFVFSPFLKEPFLVLKTVLIIYIILLSSSSTSVKIFLS